jgi:hypothetical protein
MTNANRNQPVVPEGSVDEYSVRHLGPMVLDTDGDFVRDAVRKNGFVVVQTTAREFEHLGASLGIAVSGRRGGPTTDRLTPMPAVAAPPRSLSAIFGLSEFPFHTDGAHHRVPPRYLLLRLADGAQAETPTLVADGRLAELDRDEASLLSREMWLVKGGRGRTFYAPIFDASRMLLRFDLGCMDAPAGTRLDGAQVIHEHLARGPVEEITWCTGTTLVLDNWRVFHARPSVSAGDHSRTLLRMMIG